MGRPGAGGKRGGAGEVGDLVGLGDCGDRKPKSIAGSHHFGALAQRRPHQAPHRHAAGGACGGDCDCGGGGGGGGHDNFVAAAAAATRSEEAAENSPRSGVAKRVRNQSVGGNPLASEQERSETPSGTNCVSSWACRAPWHCDGVAAQRSTTPAGGVHVVRHVAQPTSTDTHPLCITAAIMARHIAPSLRVYSSCCCSCFNTVAGSTACTASTKCSSPSAPLSAAAAAAATTDTRSVPSAR